MAQNKFIFFLYLFFFVASSLLACDASDTEDNKLHIVYMGSLPKVASYTPTFHHVSMLQQVIETNVAANHLVRSYNRSFNGFAARLNDEQREKLSNIEGVISVFPSKTLHLHTTRSWDFIGFREPVKRNQTIESDIVVGVIDSGIWPEAESFNDEGFGPVPKKWRGTCAGGSNFTCNKKIIGARAYDSGNNGDKNARDIDGHGTHTASTLGGREIKGASFYGLAQGTARGGIPSARIAAYKVCHSNGCSSVDILAAFDDCIADGVDIISISVGGPQTDFIQDVFTIGSFHAIEKGILTVQSAGNSGPEPYTTSSVTPWILTVAATSIDRQFIDKVLLDNGNVLHGKSINAFASNGKKFPIAVRNSDPRDCIGEGTSDDCSCLDEKLVKGKIVLCAAQGAEDSAYDSGAIGIISLDDNPGVFSDVSFVTPLPEVTLESKDFSVVRVYTNSTKNPYAEIMKSETVEDKSAPKVALFSSRGPNFIAEEILKPDISAPGINILAAYSPKGNPSGSQQDKRKVKYNIISGTSMSCPHVAGIAGYVKTFHPNWSPAAIKSAIMTTAQPMKGTYNTSGEFAYGAGNVNPLQAIDPGLVYDILKEDYVQMFCNLGYDAKKIKQISRENVTCHGTPDRSLVKDLNYPALVIRVEPMKSFSVKIKRTVTNVGSHHSSYKGTIVFTNSKLNGTVEPQILTFKSLNEKQSFVVTVVGEAKPKDVMYSASLVWSDGIHNVRSPIVVLDDNGKNN